MSVAVGGGARVHIGGGLRLVGVNLAIALFYFLLGIAVARFFAAFGLFPAPLWLPASIAIVAALICGPAVVPGLFLGSFVTNAVLFEPPLWVAALISVTNAAGPVLGAWLIRRVAPPAEVFASLRGLGTFVVAGILLHAAVTATGGALGIGLSEGMPLELMGSVWLTWWLSDSGGMLFLAPTLLLWFTEHRAALSRGQLLEGIAVSAVTIVASILLFSDGVVENRIVGAMPYLFALPLAWVTLRWSLRSAATLFTVVITIATAGTIAGAGPFNALGITAPLTALGIMIVLCAINILLIAALVSERRDMLARLALANRELERRVEARTRDLEAARRTAEQANAAKSRFLANVTHELRTPLNGVIGFADALQLGIYGDRPDPRYREAAGLIERSGRHLLALVDALLDMAKIEAGRFELDPTAIDLAALAREVIAVVTPMATERQVTLASELPAGVAPMLGDERAMRQILFNLLSNAIKFTRTEGRVSLSLSEQAGRIALSIADTGVGMDEGQLAIALEPFGRVDNAETHADRSGTGLGLPLSKALTEAQGGTFDVVSAPGRGTIVRMAFPRAG